MEICLSHWSSLQILRHIRALGPAFTEHALSQQHALSRNLGFKVAAQELIGLKSTYGLKDIDALVGSHAKRHKRTGVRIHYLSPPRAPSTIIEIEPGVSIVTPECMFMHLSSELNVLGLIALGYELCSIYAIGPSGKPDPSIPITTIRQLENSLDLATNKRRAQRALKYILEHSRSPRESETAMKLSLPSNMGGFGLKGIIMNSKVALNEDNQKICSKKNCYPDILFPASKLVFEYDGYEFHQGNEQEDELRRIALANEGYHIERITYERLTSREEMKRMANMVSLANTGHSLRIRSDNWEESNRQLFAKLKNGVHVDNSKLWRV